MKTIQINEIEGFQIGSAQDTENATGCTVILCKEGATAGVDVRGGGPATRETDLLNPKNMVQKIHAVTLSGGSAFGLESSSGVMQYLSEHEIGFDMKNIYIPIVCEACLFDCGVGNSKAYPNKQMGYDACIGTHNRMEKDIIPKLGIKYIGLEIYGFSKKNIIRDFKNVFLIKKSIKECISIMNEFKPDIVIGVGGYVTYPVIKAAKNLHIPTFIHEQNSIPGKSNIMLSKYVDCVGVSFNCCRY